MYCYFILVLIFGYVRVWESNKGVIVICFFLFSDIILGNMAIGQGNMITGHQGGIDMTAFQSASKLFDPSCSVANCYSDY